VSLPRKLPPLAHITDRLEQGNTPRTRAGALLYVSSLPIKDSELTLMSLLQVPRVGDQQRCKLVSWSARGWLLLVRAACHAAQPTTLVLGEYKERAPGSACNITNQTTGLTSRRACVPSPVGARDRPASSRITYPAAKNIVINNHFEIRDEGT
jgi:hypothetical protein